MTMTKRAIPVLLAVAALALAPPRAKADPLPYTDHVCASAFTICIDFTIALTNTQGATSTNTGGFSWLFGGSVASSPLYTYTVTANFLNGDGVLTDFGIFGSPNLGATPTGASDGYTASTSCTSLNPANVQVCADANPPPVGNGITAGHSAWFTFTSGTSLATTSFGPNGLGFAGHIQGYGPTSCSIKVGSEYVYTNGVITAGTDCVPTTTVPEPVSAILLATGLIGTGLLRRRRRGNDVTNG